MATFNTIVGTRKGLAPSTVDCESMHVVNTAQVVDNVAIGSIMQLDHLWTSTETTNSIPGDTGSSFVNLVDPATVELDTGTFVVALEAVVKSGDGRFRLKGRAQCLVNNTTNGTLTEGTLLGPVNGQNYLSDAPVSGAKLIARLDEDSPTADDGTTLRWCWFDGE